MFDWIPNAPPIEKQVDCKCMEFAATGCCTWKQFRLDRTIRKLDMFDNYYTNHKTCNIITILFFN